MSKIDPWLPFRVPEPKQEPGTYPARELWKEFPPEKPELPPLPPLREREPRGKEIPAKDSPLRWSVPATGPLTAFLTQHPAPAHDSGAGKRLKFICSYLDGTANGLRSCNGMYTEEWLAKRWSYFWNSGLQTLRISLPHNPYDNFDPVRLFLRHLEEIGRMLDRVAGVTCLRPCEVNAIHSSIMADLSYRHDYLDLRYQALAELHYVLHWTKASMWDEFNLAGPDIHG